jgi:hypothetical protein
MKIWVLRSKDRNNLLKVGKTVKKPKVQGFNVQGSKVQSSGVQSSKVRGFESNESQIKIQNSKFLNFSPILPISHSPILK